MPRCQRAFSGAFCRCRWPPSRLTFQKPFDPLMQPINKPVSKWRVAFTWIGMVGLIIAITALFVWRNQIRSADKEAIPGAFNSVFMLVVGSFCLLSGVAAYAVTIATD